MFRKAAAPAQLRHRIPGRTRLRLQAPVPEADRLEVLADKLSALAGVHAVDINPATGSVLIRHEPDCDPLGAATAARLIDLLPPPEPEPFDPTGAILRQLEAADAAVTRASSGRLDLMQATIGGLVLLGLVQLGRGRVAGPALTLFGQAASLAMGRPLLKFVR